MTPRVCMAGFPGLLLAGIGLLAPVPNLDGVRATVGKFVGIRCGQTRLIGVITDVSIQKLAVARQKAEYV